MMRRLALFLLAALLLPAAENTLSPAEKKAGWKLLFDGKTMKNWRDPARKNQPGDAWLVEDGCLRTRVKPRISEDLITEESFGDFELQFDWKVSPRGNTGVKYRIQKEVFIDDAKQQTGPGGFEGLVGRELAHPLSDRAALAPGATGQVYTVSFEFQLLDDQRHPDAKRDNSHKTGALYSMIAPSSYPARPAGEWNHGLLVLRGNHVEHWINGAKVLDGSLDSDMVRAAVAKRWAPAPPVREMLTHPKQEGPLCLQHHGDLVWFRNLKIRRTDAAAVK